MATFKNRLAEIMAERDMTQSELSRLTGIRVSSISDYLRGIYEAKQDKVFQIAEALRVNPAWLMGLDVSREWPSQENMEFKDILKQLRLERGLSQQELAQKSGLSASSIGMYEQGRRKPSFEILEIFADTFNVDLDYLLGRAKNPKSFSKILTRAQDELSPEDLKSLEDMAEFFLSRSKDE